MALVPDRRGNPTYRPLARAFEVFSEAIERSLLLLLVGRSTYSRVLNHYGLVHRPASRTFVIPYGMHPIASAAAGLQSWI